MRTPQQKRTPQEKKRLSYAKDRRNIYGESPHGARKSIPRNKALRNRANRHQQDQALAAIGFKPDQEWADAVESLMKHRAPSCWTKVPDEPLLTVISWKKECRGATNAAGCRRARAGNASHSKAD